MWGSNSPSDEECSRTTQRVYQVCDGVHLLLTHHHLSSLDQQLPQKDNKNILLGINSKRIKFKDHKWFIDIFTVKWPLILFHELYLWFYGNCDNNAWDICNQTIYNQWIVYLGYPQAVRSISLTWFLKVANPTQQ